MPPPIVRTIRDLIYYKYAQIIADSSGMGKKNYGFVISRFKKLRDGEISWSTAIREYIKEREVANECIYCGSHDKLTLDHIIPTSRGGTNLPENAIWVCQKCNSSKGSKRLYEWYGLDHRNELPRIAEGKYLKELYEIHASMGTLDIAKEDILQLCERCDLGEKCPEKQKLTVYCLEGLLLKKT
jgi:hypothetical protein